MPTCNWFCVYDVFDYLCIQISAKKISTTVLGLAGQIRTATTGSRPSYCLQQSNPDHCLLSPGSKGSKRRGATLDGMHAPGFALLWFRASFTKQWLGIRSVWRSAQWVPRSPWIPSVRVQSSPLFTSETTSTFWDFFLMVLVLFFSPWVWTPEEHFGSRVWVFTLVLCILQACRLGWVCLLLTIQ
jgi:hypothetical protein